MNDLFTEKLVDRITASVGAAMPTEDEPLGKRRFGGTLQSADVGGASFGRWSCAQKAQQTADFRCTMRRCETCWCQ